MEWNYTDPRDVLFGRKQAEVVVVRPSSEGRGITETGCGSVEMKNGRTVSIDFPSHPAILDVDDKWDRSWCWVLSPARDEVP